MAGEEAVELAGLSKVAKRLLEFAQVSGGGVHRSCLCALSRGRLADRVRIESSLDCLLHKAGVRGSETLEELNGAMVGLGLEVGLRVFFVLAVVITQREAFCGEQLHHAQQL